MEAYSNIPKQIESRSMAGELWPMDCGRIMMIILVFVEALHRRPSTSDIQTLDILRPLFPFPERLSSVFSTLGEKAIS